MVEDQNKAADPGHPGVVPVEHWLVRNVVPVFGTLLVLIALAWSGDVPLKLGVGIYTEQALAAILGLALVIAFLKVPVTGVGSGPRLTIPWYDLIAAALALYVTVHITWRYPVLAQEFFFRPTETFVIGIILLPLVLEGLRRTAGRSLFIVLLIFLAYGLIGHLVPGKLAGRSMELPKLVSYLAIDNVALFGLAMNIVGTVVVMFVFFGQLLHKSGGSAWFTDLAACLMGRTRGGSAKIAVMASGLFGTISGSAVANVVSTGVVTIPLMKNAGFKPKVAAAFEAVASTGGQIMPPIMGAAAFLMAEFLEMPYTEVILAALIPAVLYYVAVFVQADLEAARCGIKAVPEDQIPTIASVLKSGWFFAVPFVVLIAAMFSFNRTPEESALWGAGTIIVLSMLIGYKGKRIGPADVIRAVRDTGVSAIDIVLIGAMAGLIIGVLEVTGLSFGLSFVLVQFGEGNLALLLLMTAVVSIILGMGMPTTAIYFLLATLAAPPLIKLGVEPIAAHMFVMYFGLMSMITPPVAIAAFAAANLAGSKPMETGFSAVRLGWTAYIMPFLFVLSPSLLMQGSVATVALAFVTAVAGVWFASVGLVGYLTRELPMPLRGAFFVAGVGLLVPSGAFAYAPYVEMTGGALAALLLGNEFLAKRQLRAESRRA